MHITPFAATYPILDLIAAPDSFFSSIKSNFQEYQASGFYRRKKKEAIYILNIKNKFGDHYGIIADNHLSDLDNDKILKHENTLDVKEQDMMNFLLYAKAMVKPILLGYKEVPEISLWIEQNIAGKKPFMEISFKNSEQHTYWEVESMDEIQRIKELFEDKVSRCYIADGHHRCATVLKLVNNRFLAREGIHLTHILSAYFSFSNLQIFDYNRVVELPPDLSHARFMAHLSNVCKITPISRAVKPRKQGTIHLVMGNEWYKLEWKKSVLKKHAKKEILLDTHLVNKYIFKNILEIADVRSDPRIAYYEGVVSLKSLTKAVKKSSSKVGILIPPITQDDLLHAAEDHINLPPKSTWFEPRIRSGIIVNDFPTP